MDNKCRNRQSYSGYKPSTIAHPPSPRRRSPAFWWFLAVLYLGLVIVAAFEPEFGGEATRVLIRRIFPALGAEAVEITAFWLRQAVHFLAYAGLAAILYRALEADKRGAKAPVLRRAALAALIALAVAILDETLQARSPARQGRAGDVVLDLAGIVAGAGISGSVGKQREK